MATTLTSPTPDVPGSPSTNPAGLPQAAFPRTEDVFPPLRRTPRHAPIPKSGRTLGLTEIVLMITFAGSSLAIGYSYRLAASPGTDPMAPFTPFWIGLVAWVVVAATVLLRTRSTAFQCTLTLLASGLLMSVPKLMRTPLRPLYFDEMAHWAQSQYMEQTGAIDRNSVVTIMAEYPGLHAMTTAIHEVTHLSTWQLGTALLLVLRAIVPLLIRQIALAARVPVRAANIAALIYLLNPGFMFFNAMYAYQSFAIVFQIAALMLALRVLITTRDKAQANVRLALVAAAAATVTHHLTSLFLAGVVLLIPIVALRSWAPKASRRRELMTVVGVIEIVVLWTAANIASIWAYLGVFPQQAAAQFTKLLSSSDRAPGSDPGTSRELLQNTGLPWYETRLALASVVIALLFGFIGVLLMLRHRKSPVVRTLAVICVAYPLSLPLVITPSGAPGAHRSWPFSYEGLAVFMAVGLVALAGAAGRMLVVRRTLVVALICGLMIGNCASENPATLRFPGTFVLGTEGRAQSPQLISVAEWSGRELGSTGTVIADYYTGGYVAAFGKAPVAAAFPAWDLLFYDNPPPDRTIRLLTKERVGFAVVDRRLSTGVFAIQFYIDASEPGAGTRTTPITASALVKFEAYPWMEKVLSSTDYDVYRFDMERWQDPARTAIGAATAGTAPTAGTAATAGSAATASTAVQQR